MIHEGETTHGAEPAAPTGRRPVRVRISLFFDGTGNNRRNIQHKADNSETYQRVRSWWTNWFPADSYEADHSNVSRLEERVGDRVPGFDHYVHVYVEGIGTADGRADYPIDLAFGTEVTGIRAKVVDGLKTAANLLTTHYVTRADFVDFTEVVFDTCGFSRGAAAARHCVHRVLHDPVLGFRAWLSRFGWRVNANAVKVQAVGLFDTVSSHGGRFDDDVDELQLDAVREAAAVYQLAAAEEYRENFGLTTIDSAGSKGRQVYLPGAHSDVGGGYNDGETEEWTFREGDAARAVGRFLLDQGYYQGTLDGPELRYTPSRVTRVPVPLAPAAYQPARVAGRRAPIQQEYSFIPLHLMADWLVEQDVPVDTGELLDAFNPDGVPLREAIEQYARGGGASSPGDWRDRRDRPMRQLRRGYLHVSFREDGVGHTVLLAPGDRPTRHRFQDNLG